MPDLIVTVTFKERETPHTQDTLKCALNLSPTTTGHHAIQQIPSGGIQIDKSKY